ncbi:alkaline phosphatase [Candidatus Epulonipiscium fishelsonii]|uniref:Alkaline phosphatase n=1 Tax=Candidatus Epulonipiscium fishelsonii TaxID=77094 RepID=A0ACC8X8P4_9FIRM|nr:alkaline phosphatase [Epulopiscium sp. SCG-B11WGA-EpuloA1]ONI38948.1 alkaline phosphatase [Epulopiscium sp. SCG-B05WGA-EpuloA1]
MNMEWLNTYLLSYGFIALFIVVLLEYMNLPGFPSGVIMPLGGLWIYNNNLSFTQGLLVTVAAGLVGSWILYFIGRIGGDLLLKKYLKKFPKQQNTITKSIQTLKKHGNWAIFTSKLLPVTRTLMPIPAGAIKLDFINYTIYSTLGILVWNYGFMSIGYYFGDIALSIVN